MRVPHYSPTTRNLSLPPLASGPPLALPYGLGPQIAPSATPVVEMRLHEDLTEDHPTGKPITSLSRTSTGRSGTIGDVITSPAAQGPPPAGLKRKLEDLTDSGNLWSETRFRSGHGIRLLRLYGGARNAPLQGRLILSEGMRRMKLYHMQENLKKAILPSVYSLPAQLTP